MREIRREEAEMRRAAASLVQHLAEVGTAAIRRFQNGGVTCGGRIQARQKRGKTNWISPGKKKSFIQADHPAAVAKNCGQVIPGKRSDVYFAISIKYRWKRSSPVNSGWKEVASR